ncbi:MAG: LPS assembly lipoprotein LptE [Burkholderiaceae bacterium]
MRCPPLKHAHPFPALAQPARALACIVLCVLLSACGFKLRGVSPLPFNTMYTNIPENSDFGSRLRRALTASSPHTRFVADAAAADAKLIQLSNNQSLREVSINAQGLVEEYELNLAFIFQLTDAKGHVLLAPTTLTATREIPYDATAVQAKQGEIGNLFIEMQQSLIDRVIRRLTSPDVTEAVKNAESGPVEANPADITPIAPRTRPPMPLSNVPGTGLH